MSLNLFTVACTCMYHLLLGHTMVMHNMYHDCNFCHGPEQQSIHRQFQDSVGKQSSLLKDIPCMVMSNDDVWRLMFVQTASCIRF